MIKIEEFGTKSVVMNPVIASLLHRADYIEKIGTGISRIRNAVREHGHGGVEFIFTGFFTVRFSRGELSVEKTVEKILSIIKSDPHITQKRLAELTGLTSRGIEWNIKKLKEDKRIIRVGPDRGGHWDVLDE